jgi:4-diphosphocytidyl-2-C-methyl-D-erythritol kinase
MSPPFSAEERAPAKVNLFLHVGPPEADGRHPLESLVVFADVGDTLAYAPGGTLSLTIGGAAGQGLSAGEDNLILRAARALAQAAGVSPSGALTLRKHLPVASGIGGGSADAAAALRLLNRAWGLGQSPASLAAIGAELGSDVPACVIGAPALMSGTGETLAPAPLLPDMNAILVNPGVALATGDVYRAFDALGAAPTLTTRRFPHCGSTQAVVHALNSRRNDLERAAIGLAPGIAAVLSALRDQAGVRFARMSGSGATCFALFDTALAARTAAKRFSVTHPSWWTVATRLIGVAAAGRR